MEVCPIITSIIGALSSANNTVNLSTITYREGNEDKVDQVVNILKLVLTDKGLMKNGVLDSEKTEEIRKITFFLILNSDLDILNDLANSDNLGHLVWTTPTISKCLLINLVWELKLTDYFCEAIQYSCFDLSYELITTATKNLRHLSPEESVVIVSKLVTSIYKQNESLKHYNVQIVNNFHSKLTKIHDLIYELLKYYTDPPNKHKLASLSTYKLYLHLGKAVLCFLEMLIGCFTPHVVNSRVSPKVLQLYQTTFDEQKENSTENIKNMTNELMSFFDKLNTKLLDVLKANVMAINVDVYCSWCEFDYDLDKTKSLQRVVGEAAFKLLGILESDSRYDHDVKSFLPSITIKPIEVADCILEADEDTLISNCSKVSSDQPQWLSALIHKDLFLHNENLINCALQNCEYFAPEDVKLVIVNGMTAVYSEVKYEHINVIKTMILRMLLRVPNNEQSSFISSLYTDQRVIGDELERNDFETQLAEFCNKLININDIPLSSIYNLFLQNPKKLTRALLNTAVNSESQFENILQMFEITTRLGRVNIKVDEETTGSISALIVQELKLLEIDKSSYEMQNNFTNFVIILHDKQLVDEETMFLKLVMSTISEFLSVKNNNLLPYMKILERVYNHETRPNYAAPILVMIGQVMEEFRWEEEDFSWCSLRLMDWATNFISNNIKNYFDTIKNKGNKRTWLLENLSFLSPINAYYFQSILSKSNGSNFIDLTLKDEEIKRCLNYLIPRSTSREFALVFNELKSKESFLKTFDILSDSILKVSSKAEDSKSPEAFECLAHCLGEFCTMLMHHIPDRESTVSDMEYLKMLFSFIKSLHLHIHHKAFMIFSPLITDILKKCKIEGVTTEELEKLGDFLIDLQSKEDFAKICLKI